MTGTERRLARLERPAPEAPRPVRYVCLDRPDETEEEALARYLAAHPEGAGCTLYVVDTGLYRSPGDPTLEEGARR